LLIDHLIDMPWLCAL